MALLETFKARPLGVNRDLAPSETPPNVWNYAKNLLFDDDRGFRQKGYTYRTPAPLFAIERMLYRRFDGVDQWLYAGPDGIGIDTGEQNDITPAAYAVEADGHSWCDLNGIPVWNNRGMAPQYHDGNELNAMVELPGWPDGWRAITMRSFKFFLLALGVADGTGDYDNQVRWSASADAGNLPAEWVPSPSNDAGDMIFAGTPGVIVDGLSLRDSFVIYKPGSTYLMQYIGNPFVFSQRKVFTTSGLLSRDCVAEWRGMHFCITEGDVLAHDGNQGRSVADSIVRRDIFQDISSAYLERSFVYHDPAALEMNFYWPSRSSSGFCDRRAVWNYRDDKWSLEELRPDEVSHAGIGAYRVSGLGDTWDELPWPTWEDWPGQWDDEADSSVTDQTLLAFYSIVEMGQPSVGGPRGGEAPEVSLLWASKDLGKPQRTKLVDRIWPNVIAASGVELRVQIGTQQSYGDPVTWGPVKTFTVNSDEYVDCMASGRLISVKVDSDSSQHWEMPGFDIDYRIQGRF